ncbi:serine hydrolase domain-containing protein [Hyalangium versicolor]|uniref:serine hydrolase domain-containing protein n=1 Tax=Hyalangium versicolor TaxID=2861190 RepID=UPI001CCF7A29|nr:serine hydrolase domain-containing protein [Hyalangium versicolor]
MTTVHGDCDPAFSEVRTAFEANFSDGLETGAALAIYLRGEKIVDLYGGYRDSARQEPWTRDTLVMTYSVCKPLVACAVLVLVDRGQLELDAPVAKYWPEFGQSGKHAITVRDILDHLSGLPAVRDPITVRDLYDWSTMVSLLERQEPWWKPRSAFSEQVLLYGYILGELVLRITGQGFAEFFRDQIASKLGIEFYFGVPVSEQQRCAELSGMSERDKLMYLAPKLKEAFLNPPGLLDASVVNSSPWRSALIPAVNAHGTADAVAKVYAALANRGSLGGTQLLSHRLASAILEQRRFVRDKSSKRYARISHGFIHFGGGDFGLAGAGGSFGYGNAGLEIGFAYLTREMRLGFARERRVSKALRRVLKRDRFKKWFRRLFSG